MALIIENAKRCEGVAPIMAHPLKWLRHISNPKSARRALGLSQSQMGKELARVHANGHGNRAYTRSAISHFEHGDYAVTAFTAEAYARLIAEAVSRATEGRVDVKVKFGRAWKFSPTMRCECGRMFEPRTRRQKKCKRCG